MGLFDSISGAAATRAARNNRQAIQGGLTAGTQSLANGYDAAGAILGTRDGGSALSALGQGFDQARGDVAGQYGQTQGLLSQIGQSYQPMIQGGGAAYGGYLDATGANGAAGSERATENFRAAPGYEFARDQGLDSIMRTASARGGLAGGNTTADMLRFSTGLADQTYQQYVGNLGNAAQSYGTGLAGQAAGLGLQGQASQQQGGALAALGTGRGLAEAGLYGQGSAQQAQYGKDVSGLYTNATNAQVSNNNTLAASQSQASSNFLDTLGGALSGFSNMGGLGGLRSLFS